LGEVCREAQVGFACGERDPVGVIQLRMNNVTKRGEFDWSSLVRVPTDAAAIAAYQLQRGDVLFNNTNSTDLVGKTALFVDYKEPVVFSNHFTRLRVDPDLLSSDYLALWLRLQWQQRLFANICNRWIGQSAVQRDKLLDLRIPLPPLDEQKRIAAILNEQMAAVERARAASEARLDAAKSLPAAFLRAVFNSPQAQQWPKKRLCEVCSIHPGQHVLESDYNRDGVGIGYLTGPADFGTVRPLITKWTDRPKAWCEPGDVLVTVKGAGVGKANLAPDNRTAIGRQIMAIRPTGQLVLQGFVYCVILMRFSVLQERALGSTVPGLGRDDIEMLEAPVPPVTEQKQIAAILNEQMAAVERARKAIEEELDAINRLPAALLRRAFNGDCEPQR
jgi:type I restriction enzyme S subunit